MTASETLRRHTLELAALVRRMEPGEAKDRIQARLQEAQEAYEKITPAPTQTQEEAL